MKLRCPSCGSEMSVDLCLGDVAARDLFKGFASLTPLSRAVFRYLALFRPEKRPLSWDRASALVDEIIPMIASARVTYRGRNYVADERTWIAAIDSVCAARDAGTLRTPLKSHGYLFSIIGGQADKAASADEAKHEERKRYESALRNDGSGAQSAQRDGQGKTQMPMDIKQQLAQFGSGLKREGGPSNDDET